MAIKIKNKSGKKPPEDDDEQGGPGVPPGGAPGSEMDGFERVTFKTAAWIENNRSLFFALIGLTVVAGIGIAIGVLHVRSQQLEASDRLSEGLASYELPVEDSLEMQQLEMRGQQQDFAVPEAEFADDEAKWRAVHRSAAHTLEDFDGGAIANSARMTKAAASMNLEEFDEAVRLYRAVLEDDDVSEELEAMAYVGLASSLSANGELEEAEQAWDEFVEVMPDREAYADLERARMFDRHAIREDDEQLRERARELYEQFIEEHPDSLHRDEVERRQALL